MLEFECSDGQMLRYEIRTKKNIVLSNDFGRIAIPLKDLPSLIGTLTQIHLESMKS